jgi:hypothetical protein
VGWILQSREGYHQGRDRGRDEGGILFTPLEAISTAPGTWTKFSRLLAPISCFKPLSMDAWSCRWDLTPLGINCVFPIPVIKFTLQICGREEISDNN